MVVPSGVVKVAVTGSGVEAVHVTAGEVGKIVDIVCAPR